MPPPPRWPCTLSAALALSLTAAAWAELPRRDFTVELRQITEDPVSAGSYAVRTAPTDAPLQPQQVQVRNGEQASLRIQRSIPVLWLQQASLQSGSVQTTDTKASYTGGGITQALTWLQAGQSLQVRPRWPGGKQSISVEVDVVRTGVQEGVGSELPSQTHQQVATTVTTPLRQWVTIAASGAQSVRGSYSSQPEAQGRQLLQIRVLDN